MQAQLDEQLYSQNIPTDPRRTHFLTESVTLVAYSYFTITLWQHCYIFASSKFTSPVTSGSQILLSQTQFLLVLD